MPCPTSKGKRKLRLSRLKHRLKRKSNFRRLKEAPRARQSIY